MQLEIILAFVGLILSLYAYRVKKHLDRVPSYKPLCEISDQVSCKRALQSKESNLLFVPNSAWGMFYYFLIILFVENYWIQWAFSLSVIALIMSLYLSYVLYYKQKNFCVVCWSTHLVNVFLFLFLLRAIV